MVLIQRKFREKIEAQLELVKSNYNLDKLIKMVLIASFILSFIILLFFKEKLRLAVSFSQALILYWALSFLIALVISIFFAYSNFVVKKVKRKKEIEDLLSDYLQLVAANLTAGMPIDKALWYAIREHFGVLSEEIELVARKVFGGLPLEQALLEFANKYDSDLLNKSMILLIEGLKSGGELAHLVNKIAWNVKQSQILEKEIRAEVTTYAIFIMFASLVAAPMLFALSQRIIVIMGEVISKIDLQTLSGISAQIPIKDIGKSLSAKDFKIFSYINLAITSIFSAIMVSVIRKGSVKAGIRLIPLFLAISIITFLIASIIITQLFKNIAI